MTSKSEYNQAIDEYVKSLSDLDRILILMGLITGEPALKGFSQKGLCAAATGWPMYKVDSLFEDAKAAGYIKREIDVDQTDYSNN